MILYLLLILKQRTETCSMVDVFVKMQLETQRFIILLYRERLFVHLYERNDGYCIESVYRCNPLFVYLFFTRIRHHTNTNKQINLGYREKKIEM